MALSKAQKRKLATANKKLEALSNGADKLKSELDDIIEAAGKASEDDKEDADAKVAQAQKAHDDAVAAVANQQAEVETLSIDDSQKTESKPKAASKQDDAGNEVCLRQFLGAKGMSYPGDALPDDSKTNLDMYREQGLIGQRNGPAVPSVRK